MHPHEPALERLRGLQIDTILAGATMDAMRGRFDKLRTRHEDGTAPVAVSAFQLFQTPAEIAAHLAHVLNPRPGARILEPECGLGRILDALEPYEPAEVVAVEIAPQLCAHVYKQNRPRVTLKQRDFLTCTPADLGTFDAIAMNPPFHMRDDIRHIQHARQFLKPGARLAGLCMDTHHRETAFKADASLWLKLPAGTFRAEATSVPTVLFVLNA